MSKTKMELVIDLHYRDFSPMQFGSETCDPGHFFGPSVRTHWLLHYVVYGFGKFKKDGKEWQVKQGDIFVIQPYEETYYEADKRKPWRYIWIGFTCQAEVPEALKSPVVHCPGAGKIFEDMLYCGKLNNGKTAYLCAKLWELFSLLLEDSDKELDYVQKALHYMNSEYVNGITVQQVADVLNLSRCYLSDLFKKQMGISPQKYLINLRLEKAAELMIFYGESPTTAGNSVGYPDVYHFSKIFKQHFGLSPKKYQQIHVKERDLKETKASAQKS